MTEDGGAAASGRNEPKLIVRLVSLVFVALCVVFVVLLVLRDWPATVAALRHARLWWLVPAAACAFGGMFVLAWQWGAAIIAVGGEPTGHHRVISAFFVGEVGKCIPGAVWAMLGRSELARREGHERSIAYSSVALSIIGCYLAAALTALVLAVLALIGGSIAMPWWPIAVVAAVGLLAISSGRQSPNPRLGQSGELDTADVLWFPTGGGKSEAFLGLVTVALFYDRLRGKTLGTSALIRFP
jgi:uncharacterized membrane protein YbhN (UPF0104 family)